MNFRASRNGFTLIEVVVALAILATTLYGGFFLMQRTVGTTQHLRDSVLANWVAANAYADAILNGSDYDEGPLVEQTVSMFGEDYLVTIDVTDFEAKEADEQYTSVTSISVAKSDAPDLKLEDLVVYQ
ncbi:MAG: prepilin-type N-terminal cleavage/methylation domain-containing protein [Pseudomonadota bacterium]